MQYESEKERIETDRVSKEVANVLSFLTDGDRVMPDFIRGAVIDAINQACDQTAIDAPTYDDHPNTGETETGAILKRLFSQTKLLRLKSMEEPYESIGGWNGSETFQLLTETEVEQAAEELGDHNGDAYYTGLNILLLQHLGKLAFEKRFNTLEFTISEISKGMIKTDSHAYSQGSALLQKTRERLAESTTDLLSSRAAYMADRLQKHIQAVEARSRERGAL